MLKYLKLWGCRKKNVGVQEEKRGGAGKRNHLADRRKAHQELCLEKRVQIVRAQIKILILLLVSVKDKAIASCTQHF